MGFENKEISQVEQDKFSEQRTLSDAELIAGGARFEGGTLRLTKEQIGKIHQAMARERGEISPEDDEVILKLLSGVIYERSTYNRKNPSETKPALNCAALGTLVDLRQINPPEFDSRYKPKFDWGKIKGILEAGEKGYTGYGLGSTFLEEASLFKELLPDEFARDVRISEDTWKEMIKCCNSMVNPGRFSAALQEIIALEGKGRRFGEGMKRAANIKYLNEKRFRNDVKITDEHIEQFKRYVAKVIEEEKNTRIPRIPYVYGPEYERALRILMQTEQRQ